MAEEDAMADELAAMLESAGATVNQFEAERDAELSRAREEEAALLAKRKAVREEKLAEQQRIIEKEQRKRLKAKRRERRKENARMGIVEPELESDSGSDPESVSSDEDEDGAGGRDDGGDDLAETEAAAQRIQAMQRGKAARKDLNDQKAAATKMQAVQRGRTERAQVKHRKEEADAATRVQAMQRGRQSRREMDEQKAAATKIAAMQRGKLARQELEEQKAAAQKIQAMQRGKLSRQELEEQKAAATKLQAMQRGKTSRKEVADMQQQLAKDAAVRQEAAWEDEEAERAAATKIQAVHRGKNTRRDLENNPVVQQVPLPESQAESEQPPPPIEAPEYDDDEFDEGPEPPTFAEIPLHERQEALLHVLAAHRDDAGADSEWSETASQMSTAPAGQRAREFMGKIGEYSIRKVQEHRTKQQETFDNLNKVEQMLLGAGRMTEAAQIRALAQDLANPDADVRRQNAAKKEVSSDKFLRFLQSQAQSRSEDVLMGKIKDTMYEEDPNNLSRLPPIAHVQPAADDSNAAREPSGQLSEYGTRLPALYPETVDRRNNSQNDDDDDDPDSLLVDAELLKYWESVAGEAPEGTQVPSMFSNIGDQKKKKKKSDNGAPVALGHQTFDQYKADIKERKTGTGALSRPLHGINSVDKSFYGLIHESEVGALIRDDTRENWTQLTRSLANTGGTKESATVVAKAVEEVGTQGRDMYAPPKARVHQGGKHSRIAAVPEPSFGGPSMNSTSRRPASRAKSSRKGTAGSPREGERISPDYFLKQCMALALKAGVDPDEQAHILHRFESHKVDLECSDQAGNGLLLMVAGNKDVDVGLFRMLLEAGSSVHAKNNEAQSALHEAARAGNEAVARVLLGHEETEYGTATGAGKSKKGLLPVDIENLYNETPLHVAARAGHGEMVTLLLHCGADPDNESGKAQTPLLAAAEAGQVDAASRLIKWGAAINFEDDEGATPIHKACKCGALQIVKQLIDVEADVNAAESDGFTALHWACNQGYIVIVNLLADKGAQVNVTDEDGESPLHRAVACGHPEIVQELLKRGAKAEAADGAGRTTLHKAANAGDVNVLKLLLSKKGLAVNARDEHGVCPLHLAASHGHAPAAALLLKHGGILDLEDSDGRTPLHYAANGNFVKVARLFLQHHAQVNYEDCEGWTPLHWAAKKDFCDLGAVLLEGGADKNWKDLRGMTPLHRAVCNDMPAFAMMLVRSKCDVNARDCRGRTALNRAVSNRRHECTTVLIEGGADVNAKDSWGHTSIHRAVATGDVETAAQLCSIGGEVNSPDVEQRTPLMWAADQLDEAMVRMLLAQGADPTLKDCNGQQASNRGSGSEVVLTMLLRAEQEGGEKPW